MTVPSVERRKRVAAAERAARGSYWIATFTGLIGSVCAAVLAHRFGPEHETAVLVVLFVLGIGLALAARLHEPPDRRRSRRWQLLSGLAIACGMAISTFARGDVVRILALTAALGMAVSAILGRPPERTGRERSETSGPEATFR